LDNGIACRESSRENPGLADRFVGTGEQINDMVPFDAETYANPSSTEPWTHTPFASCNTRWPWPAKAPASPAPIPWWVALSWREGQIVGEGFHQYEWRDHAEIVALKSAGDKARGATLYVTLEPCNHTGALALARKRSSPRAFNASSRPWTIRIPSIPAVL